MKRRLLAIGCAACLGGGLLYAGWIWNRSKAESIACTFHPEQGTVRFNLQINGQTKAVEFNMLEVKTLLSAPLYRSLVHNQIGLDQLSPSAEFQIGKYRHRLFYEPINASLLHPHTEGIITNDLFAPSPGTDGREAKRGTRLTLDFQNGLLQIEENPPDTAFRVPKGTLKLPLFRSAEGLYYVSLPVNDGTLYPFLLGLGTKNVFLPSGAVQFIDREASGYVPASGVVPITLLCDGIEVPVEAIALPGTHPAGIIGTEILARYLVVIDYRHNFLYLEPRENRAH